ncbi:phosphoribosylamine--glycine ligase [Desulfogranum marinum]|uniref:phosphoribosylamine--glycine ligase n=1 Tax=Desulfogranum marinum TaxID=453220 RepID=UPI001962D4D1|nr:phosphoribosylamine--glycine ligase [Desulfogranum marinum]MBM9511625.1 phosphoribosylamine--glycine ligase [Desulfogranum marinum]
MKILVIGSGGREHALVWKLKQSSRTSKIFCAPGNAGISKIAACVDIAAGDVESLLQFALTESIDLTVVGPEDPLTNGIVDIFEEKGLRIFGPSKAAAELEASKAFTKDFLKKYNIPSASYKVFSKPGQAKKYIDKIGAPCVVKADGLAAGKGVIIAESKDIAKQAVDSIMKEKRFGVAGEKVVVESFLRGEEASFIAFTDGKTVLPLPSSQDHKAAFEGDRGPNTGGMGAYSPAPILTDHLTMRVMNEVMLPTVRGLAEEGRPYKGMLYAGLMIENDKINVLEFNCRFGDPECQPLLMRLKSDLVDVFEHCIDQTLDEIELDIDPRPTVCVVMASGGYPGEYTKGKAITGLIKASRVKNVEVFHAGTTIANRRTVTNGGRVLGVTAIGQDIEKAIELAYQAVDEITWSECYYRRDIGHRALKRLKQQDGPSVGILMGSDSDLPVMQGAVDVLKSFNISYEIRIASAHRTPSQATEYAQTAFERGIKLIIAGAGMAAHLAGVLAAHTTVPVIGVPIDASSLNGLDALLSTVQMPPGIPVATMGIGKAGAKNAAVLAARILGITDKEMQEKLTQHALDMEQQVLEKNNALKT